MSSSRILRGDARNAVSPMPWAVTHKACPPASANEVPGSQGGGGGAPDGAEVEARIEARVRQARQAALQEGALAAEQRLRTAVDAEIKKLARATAELAGYKARLRRDAERDVVGLAVEIARRLLHREISTDPEALLGLVKAALAKIESREIHRVRTNPQFTRAIASALQAIGAPQKVEIVADAGLEPASLIFETSRGDYDASVGTQLAEIERGFADLVERRR